MTAVGRADQVEHIQHGQEHGVAGLVALVVVEQREVVDVDERDADRLAGRLRGLHPGGEEADQGAVVVRAGQRVSGAWTRPVRFGLAGQALLRGPEDQEEQDGRDRRRAEGDQRRPGAGPRRAWRGSGRRRARASARRGRCRPCCDREPLAQDRRRGHSVPGSAPASASGTIAASAAGSMAAAGSGRRTCPAFRGEERPVGAAQLRVEDRVSRCRGRRAGLELRLASGSAAAEEARSDPVSSSAATSTRTDATSPPTTALVAASVKCEVTIVACAEAVTPTSTRKAPYTSSSRTGRRIRGSEPNTEWQVSGRALITRAYERVPAPPTEPSSRILRRHPGQCAGAPPRVSRSGRVPGTVAGPRAPSRCRPVAGTSRAGPPRPAAGPGRTR